MKKKTQNLIKHFYLPYRRWQWRLTLQRIKAKAAFKIPKVEPSVAALSTLSRFI